MDYDFLNSAFGYSHKTKIINTEIDHLTDKIFLLSIDEVKAYINYGDRCKPTAYAISRGASVYDGNGAYDKNKGNCWWWLRDCSSDRTRAAAVQGDCSIFEKGYKVDRELAIRPAMWIDIS